MIEQIQIFDTTLRDGEQTPGIEFSPKQKIAIASLLVRIGVDIIEAGFPRNPEDYEATQAVAESIAGLAVRHAVTAPVVCGLARADEEDIAKCWQAIRFAERPRIHTFMGSSPIHMEKKFGVTSDEAVRMAVYGVAVAKSYTNNVQFSPEDATRSDPGFMLEMVEAAVEAGATTINIPDTTGYTNPWEYGRLISQTVDRVTAINPEVVVSAHCHNDLGMATVNAMAALLAGARQVEGTVNGIGERAGNTAWDEVVANILTRNDIYAFRTGITSERIYKLSKQVARLSGYPVSPTKPVSGKNDFAHESGIHQDGVLKHREIYEALDPKLFGQRTTLVDGKHAGRRGKAAINGAGSKVI